MFDTGAGNDRRLINITETAECYSHEYIAALLALHAFCGCDATSALKGKGHVGPIKLIKKFPRFIKPLSEIGNDWSITDRLIDEMEEFTCAVYGQHKFSSVDELRHFKIKQKCDGETDATKNLDLAALPPCKKVLIQHIRRVSIWKNAHVAKPTIPDPCENHGWTRKNGDLEPLWFLEREIVPEAMVDFLIDTVVADSASSESDEEETPYLEDLYDSDHSEESEDDS